MRDLKLDFQPPRPRLLALVLLLLGIALCLVAGLEYHALDAQLAGLVVRLEDAAQRAGQLAAAQRENRPEEVFTVTERKALQQAGMAMKVDWERLFTGIEEAVGEDVCLLAIRPDLAGKSVQISGEARSLASVLAFVEALKREPLSRVVLLSHQIRVSDPQHPVVFEIAATWIPAS